MLLRKINLYNRIQMIPLLMFIVICFSNFHPLVRRGKVISVKDGDTIEILYNGASLKIRLEHIDAPEKSQPWGKQSKIACSDFCFGKTVLVNGTKFDRYKRLLGEVEIPGGYNLNLSMVSNGHAWHFKKYSKNQNYAQTELKARKSKVGLWALSNPIPPWDWRKGTR